MRLVELESNIEIAQLLFQNNKYQETIDICTKILSNDSNSIKALKLIANSLLATKRTEDARFYLNQVLKIKPNDFEN